jgi:hypothetical protein
VGSDGGFTFAAGGSPEADDIGLAWDAAERYGVMLLWHALPEVRSVPPPALELAAAADRIRSAVRKRPYKQLARTAWGRGRLPADDGSLWLDAAGALAAMRHHMDADLPTLAAVSVLSPADWAGAVIGLVRSGVNAPVTAEDLLRYARECPEIAGLRLADEDPDAGSEPTYDPFASRAGDESIKRAFETVLPFWEVVDAVSDQRWLTGLGWWGLPRALARAWNGDFDAVGEVETADFAAQEGKWPGREPSPEDLGIHRPPLAF